MMNKKDQTMNDLWSSTFDQALRLFRNDCQQLGIDIYGIQLDPDESSYRPINKVLVIFFTKEQLDLYHLVGKYEQNWFLKFTTVEEMKLNNLQLGQFGPTIRK